MKRTIEWHDARNELPKEDGDYLVSRYFSFTNCGIYYDGTVTEVYRWRGEQKLWVSMDDLDWPINALLPQEDSSNCIVSWAERPEPYNPARDEVSG